MTCATYCLPLIALCSLPPSSSVGIFFTHILMFDIGTKISDVSNLGNCHYLDIGSIFDVKDYTAVRKVHTLNLMSADIKGVYLYIHVYICILT
jgi:hypothetical protein